MTTSVDTPRENNLISNEMATPTSMGGLFQQKLKVSFNHSHNYICFGTSNGFHIYSTYPFKKVLSCPIDGGVSVVKMYYESNIVLFTGRTPRGLYPNNKLFIWDDDKQRVIGEIAFRVPIKNIEVSKYHIFVVTEREIYVYGFEKLNLVETIHTGVNLSGLIKINYVDRENENEHERTPVVVYMGDKQGSVCISTVLGNDKKTIEAHSGTIRDVCVSRNGKYLATCSEKGTIVRLYEVSTGKKLNEFRRGSDPVHITCLEFNDNASVLLVSSDKGTIHLFNTEISDECQIKNSEFQRMGLYYIKFALPQYFHGKWSASNICFPNITTLSMFKQGNDNVIYTIGEDGQFYELDFKDPNQIRIEKCIRYYAVDSDPFSDRSSTICG